MDEAASLAHLVARVEVVRLQVAALVAARRAVDPSLDDPLLGMYLSDEKVDFLLVDEGVRGSGQCDGAAQLRQAAEAHAENHTGAGAVMRLRQLARAFDLDALDVELLVVALAPDVDDRFERLYGYLNDDVTRRRATVSLALLLARVPVVGPEGWLRFDPAGRLVGGGLVELDDQDRPFLARGLRVPDRVVAHLMGSDVCDPLVAPLCLEEGLVACDSLDLLTRPLRKPHALVHVRDDAGGGAQEWAAAAAHAAGRGVVIVDLSLLPETAAPAAAALAAAAREARLRDAVLVAGPMEAAVARGSAVLRAVAELPGTVVVHGARSWEPSWSKNTPLQLDAPELGAAAQSAAWRQALGSVTSVPDPVAVTSQFRLGPDAIRRAATSARLLAESRGQDPTGEDLIAGARHQNAGQLHRLATRLRPAVDWDDLVLPPRTIRGLRDLADRARHRHQVLRRWQMRPGGGRGTGVTALLTGESGTGKTMSAEVVAGALGLDLYVVNLATVVDKYIGETEKNLDRVLVEADGVNGVLLFDEADALFGKRSEVRDSHDRYANLEIAYLLQRLEAFDGLAILATNLPANIDEAFARRLDAVVDFPMPDVDQRRALWSKVLATVPCAGDLDLDFCGQTFELSGGNIRSAAVTAAYRAAASSTPVSMPNLVTAIAEEYRKLGRLCLPAEFGSYHETVVA